MNARHTALASFAAALLSVGTIATEGCGGGSNNGNASGNGGVGWDTPDASSIGVVEVIAARVRGETPGEATGAGAIFFSTPQVGYFLGSMPVGCTVKEETTTPPELIDGAGIISIQVGDKAGTLTWDATAKEYAFTSNDDINSSSWIAGGEDVVMQATGDTVPAFSGEFKAPHPINVTSDLTTMKAGVDFELKWTNGAASERVIVALGNAAMMGATCVFDSSAGTGTIPGNVLTTLGVGEVSFAAGSVTTTRVAVGANHIDLFAEAIEYAYATIE
ncbi:MAG: hypothetical protein FWD69_17075 [Polyangiaceae bacterium]|nr:hypothetical protein [Polyangiaceae bacterium]